MNKNERTFSISLDLWGTLIKANPEFSKAKVQLIQKHFPDAYEFHILQCFSATKKEFNSIIETSGWQPPRDVLWRALCSKIKGSYYSENIYQLCDQYQRLFIQYLPSLYDDTTSLYVKKLYDLVRSKNGELIISSNTMFIEGRTLKSVLRRLDIDQYFNLYNFSDEMRASKPNPIMYEASNSYTHFHIGDNGVTDGIGPELVGSKSIIINSNKNTLKDAYDFINQNR